MSPQRTSRVAWIAIVGLSLAAYFVFTHWLQPTPFYTVKYDPEMQYFENSLAFFDGVSYAYIDHPGTPVEVIGTFILALTRPLTRGLGEFFVPYHLQHPELFLSLAHGLLTILSLGVVSLLAWKAFPVKEQGGLVLGIGIAVLNFAVLAPLSFKALHWWTHNAFNFPFGTLLLIGLLLRLRRSERLSHLGIFCLGLLSGILVAVQIYFVAWAVGVVAAITLYEYLLTRRIRKALGAMLLTLTGSAVGFYIAFAPVMHRFRRFYIWMKDLVLHQGRYGGGQEGFSSPGQMVDNLVWLWNRGQLILIVSLTGLVLLGIAMWWRRRETESFPGWWSMSVGVLAQTILLWVLIVKHPGQNYLLTIAAVLPIQFVLIGDVFLKHSTRAARIVRVLGWLMILGYVWGLVSAFQAHVKLSRQVALTEELVAEAIQTAGERSGKDPEELVILWGYGVAAKCYALRFGNFSTEGAALTREINDICPGEWTYDIWSEVVELPNAYQKLWENDDWDLVILPENFIPKDPEFRGEITILEVQTEGYGRLTLLTPPIGEK